MPLSPVQHRFLPAALRKPVPYLDVSKTLVQVVGATMLMALCAHISLVLPGSPAPHTMQTFAVLLVSLTLAPQASVVAMLLYLLEGAAGLPVFSPHGPGGVAQLAGLSGGYLLSYPVAAAVTGTTFRALRRFVPAMLAAIAGSAAGNAAILLAGSAWMAALLHLPLRRAMDLGTLPFVTGDAFKLAMAAALSTLLLLAGKATAAKR